MRDCYDSLLSAAAATANSAYGILFLLEETIYFLLFFSMAYTLVLCTTKQVPLWYQIKDLSRFAYFYNAHQSDPYMNQKCYITATLFLQFSF